MAFFDRLYVERLAQKTKVFQQWLDQTANDWENVLFIALAKGFGLSVNALVFAAIAQCIPFSVIRKTQDHEELDALLFGQAEMLKTEMDDAYLEKLQKNIAMHSTNFNSMVSMRKSNFLECALVVSLPFVCLNWHSFMFFIHSY